MTPVLKTINNSHVTLETLKAFNEYIDSVFKCRLGYIDKIVCYHQYAAETSWQDTTMAMSAILNNIPVGYHRLLVQHIRNNYQREMNLGDTTVAISNMDVRHSAVCQINLRTNSVVEIAGAITTNVPTEVRSAKGEIRIPIPEGYDGNMAFVELFVPREVINAMHKRKTDTNWDIVAGLIHPLADVSDDRPHASCDGYYRPHALLFYQRYTKKSTSGRNTIKLDVAKSKNWVSILTRATVFNGPFKAGITDVIEPLVGVQITCYKYGVR